jgi:hypothetical protein
MEYLEAHERTSEVIKYSDDYFVEYFEWLEKEGYVLECYDNPSLRTPYSYSYPTMACT